MDKLVSNLKLCKCRVPYFKLKLNENVVRELDSVGEAVAVLSLRYNYPVLSGINYGKNRFCTIVSKKMIKGEYYYFLKTRG